MNGPPQERAVTRQAAMIDDFALMLLLILGSLPLLLLVRVPRRQAAAPGN